MKKIVAVILMVASLTMITAQAEVVLVGTGYEWNRETESYDNYVVLESETGDCVKLHVTEEEMNEYIRQDFRKREKEQFKDQSRSWFENAVDWITFWD